MSYFGSRLKYLRKQDNVTQQELATALKISKSTVSMYENGNREPDFETLEAIADFFNVPMDTFFPNESKFTAPADELSAAEQELVRRYRKATDADRAVVDLVLEKYAAPSSSGVQVG